MEDMIIKGTGNSRYLKSVANIMTLYPTYESFATALANGTFPIDLNGINPAGVETPGTRLNKASLLTDALCTALGLETTATPTQALSKLNDIKNGKIVYGTYTGNGAASMHISVGFGPKAVLVFGLKGCASYVFEYPNYHRYYGGLASSGNDIIDILVRTTSGFYVYYKYNSDSRKTYGTNVSGMVYSYIAFQ